MPPSRPSASWRGGPNTNIRSSLTNIEAGKVIRLKAPNNALFDKEPEPLRPNPPGTDAAGPGLTLHDIELIAEPTHLRHNESRHPFHSPPSPLIHGIYELEGDILKLCLSIGGGPNDRPKEFATRAGPPEPVSTFTAGSGRSTRNRTSTIQTIRRSRARNTRRCIDNHAGHGRSPPLSHSWSLVFTSECDAGGL